MPGKPCPYCGEFLDPPPVRKRDCPACQKPIYVRNGTPVTEVDAYRYDQQYGNPKKWDAGYGPDSTAPPVQTPPTHYTSPPPVRVPPPEAVLFATPAEPPPAFSFDEQPSVSHEPSHCIGCSKPLRNRVSCGTCGAVLCSEMCYRRHVKLHPVRVPQAQSTGCSSTALAALTIALLGACVIFGCVGLAMNKGTERATLPGVPITSRTVRIK